MTDSVLARALTLLQAFDRAHPVLTLPELAARTGLPRSTAHRHVADLVSWGALDRARGGGYQVGLRIVELAACCPRGPGLRDAALPFLEDLYEATHQNVQLAVRDGVEIVYVELLAARDAVAVRTQVGARWPLHATGVGLAILAHSPGDVQQQILDAPLAVFTDKTIRTTESLRRALAEVRQTGVAISDGQVTLDGYSVAAPIFGAHGDVVAAVSLVLPADDSRRSAWAPAVRTAARGISRQLAASGQPATTRAGAAPTAPGSNRSS